jgi:hypothetical protein
MTQLPAPASRGVVANPARRRWFLLRRRPQGLLPPARRIRRNQVAVPAGVAAGTAAYPWIALSLIPRVVAARLLYGYHVTALLRLYTFIYGHSKACSYSKACGGGQAQTRWRSPYAWSMRRTGGQYFARRRAGKPAAPAGPG